MAASEYAYLCTILIGVLSSSTALQGSNVNVENGIGGYQVGRLYAYSFLSSAQILENVNLTIQAQVSFAVLPAARRAEENEVHVDVSDLSAVWSTPRGNTSEPNFLGTLSNWFSLVKEENSGGVSAVYYPRTESNATVAFKKSLSQLISIVAVVTRTVEDGRVFVVRGKSQRSEGRNYVDVQKELRYNAEGILVVATSSESVHINHSHVDQNHAPSSSQLLNFPLQSQSRLTLLNDAVPPTLTRPQDLIRDSVSVKQVRDIRPLSEILPVITNVLTSCSPSDCPGLLLPVLQNLDSQDVVSLLREVVATVSQKLLLADAIGAAGVGGDTLAAFIDPNEEEKLVERILMNFALGHFPVTQLSVDSTLALLSSPLESELGSSVSERSPGSITPHLQHVAVLSLGGMAGILTNQNPQLANQIKTFLHNELEHISDGSPASSSRLRRSADIGQTDPLLHAVVLDSIGNARAAELQEGVVRHLTDASSLSVKHSAVKALGKFGTTESAEVLLHVAQTSPHPALVHMAAAAYSSHSHKTQDVSHLLATPPSSSHHRSRRQAQNADSADLSVSMPSVNWNREFGDNNISVALNRRLRNTFNIETTPLTSRYSFSIYDDTTFNADLELSGGSQLNQMWGAELCLQGVAEYDRNILQSPSYNATAEQFQRLQIISPSLESDFTEAYTLISGSVAAYSLAAGRVNSALSSLPSRVSAVRDSLVRYESAAVSLMDGYLKERAREIHLNINTTLAAVQELMSPAVQSISVALTDLVPSRPDTFAATVLVDSLPFTEGRFLVRYIPAAPQQAMTNIFNVYRSSLSGFQELSSSYEALDVQLDRYGVNNLWLSPQNSLRNLRSDLIILTRNIEATMAAYNYLQLSEAELASFRQLLSTVTSDLQHSLDLMEEVGTDITAARQEIARAFNGSRAGMDAFTRAYVRARQEIDAIFGQKFHPGFPRAIKSCDTNGCGYYPSTVSGAYNAGIDVVVSPLTSVPSPLSAYVQRLNVSILPVSFQSLYSSSRYENAILVTPAELSYNGVQFILSNCVPLPSVGGEPVFISAGTTIATATNLHMELIKTIGGQSFRLDPTSFLQPNTEPVVTSQLQCNDVVTSVGGAVVDRRTFVTSPISRQLIGSSLTDVPGHEFPQTFDIISTANVSIQPPSQVTFFQSSTFLMVGQIPIQFEFSGVGVYNLGMSLESGFLSGRSTITSHPAFSAGARGSVRVGSTTYADVSLQGTLLETELPLTLTQDIASSPLLASSSMDIVLVPSTVNLTSQLIRRQIGGSTGGGASSVEVLEDSVIWFYSIPPLQRNEFNYEGVFRDATPPIFTSLTLTDSDCLVRQLPGRDYGNPAFELVALAADLEGKSEMQVGVGTSSGFDNVLPFRTFRGDMLTLYQPLQPAVELFFTVIASNRDGVQSRANCGLPGGHFYDRSPPQARINPIRSVSSNPTQIQVLLSLFDEYGLEEVQEIAVGTVPGSQGSQIQNWMPFNASLIQTPPVNTGAVLDQFSFARFGRLVLGFLDVIYGSINVSACGRSCLSQVDCRSFDYSSADQVCILHGAIEGPSNMSGQDNIFSTPPLQTARGYEHYERLGAGNSTQLLLTGLSLNHGVMYYINLRLQNRLGYQSVVSSPGFLVDLTPPEPILIGPSSSITMMTQDVYPQGCQDVDMSLPGCIDSVHPRTLDMLYQDGSRSGSVFNGPTFLMDASFTSSSTILSANWNPFLDPESNIYSYTWCIGTSVGLCDIVPFTDPHIANGIASREAWTLAGVATGLNLTEGAYYVTVRATNDIAYGGPLFTTVHHSNPFVVDTTPPVVRDSIDVSYNSSTNQLSVNYTVSDSQGQLSTVELALGRSELDMNVLGWQLLSARPQPGPNEDTITVFVPDGVPVWLKLRVTDAAGLRAIFAAEDFFTIDRTPPLGGRVNDGRSNGLDTDFIGADRTYCINWAGFSDPESGLGLMTWTIVRASGNMVVTSRNVTQSERMEGVACETLPSLTHNMTYYSMLAVSNAAMEMQTVTVSTNGVLVDETAPEISIGGVVSFNHDFSSFIGSSSSLSVSWPAFVDYESGIDRHVVRVQVNGQLAYSQTQAGTGLEFQGNIFQFTHGDMVLVEVEGFNGAGGSAVVQSPTVLVDLTPPEVSAIVDGSVLTEDLAYQSNNTFLSVTWSAQDGISSIASVSAVVYEVRAGHRTRLHPVLPDVGVAFSTNPMTDTIRGLQLASGARYHVELTFTNGAGLTARYETDGVVVDLTPPTMHSVQVLSGAYVAEAAPMATDAVAVVTNPNMTEVRWTGTDPESGIDRYLVGVVDANGTQVLPVEEEFAGSSVGGVLMLPSELPDGMYTVYVTAINRAQTASTSTLSSSFRISTGAGAGIVLDGPADASMATNFDLDYTDEVTAVTARFHGFTSEGCSGGIAKYEWAVHTSGSSPATLFDFTTAGIFENEPGSGSGHAQLPVSGLTQWSGHRLFTTVRAVTGCGRVSQATSDGFVVDTSPPTLRVQVANGDQSSGDDGSDGGLYTRISSYSAGWQAEDTESGVTGEALVSIGTYPGGRDIAGPRPLSNDHLRSTDISPDGIPTYVSVMVTNGAGAESEEVSEPITLDTSPPGMGELNCSVLSYPLPLVGVADDVSSINATSGRFVCHWSGIEDSQSALLQYTIAIGTSLIDQSVLGVTRLPVDRRSFTSPMFTSLVLSRPYYVVLTATNRAGLERVSTSSALYLDATPPVFQGRLFIYPNFKMADYLSGRLVNVTLVGGALEDTVCLLENDVVSIIFGIPSDLESNSAGVGFTYEMGIGYRAGNDDFWRFSRIFPIPLPSGFSLSSALTSQLFYRLSRLNLAAAGRRPLFVTIKVSNTVGLYSLLASGPVYVKLNSTAEPTWIRDGINSDSDVEYQSSTVEIGARFSLGVNCPIRGGRWAVESVDGNLTQTYTAFMKGPMSPGSEVVLSTDRVQLFNEETYRVLVQVTDLTGEVHILRSDGVTVTTRAVKPGRVTDGPVPNQDLNYQESLTSLSACWSGFGDGSPEQTIDYYEVAAGNDPSLSHTRSSVAPFVNVGRNMCHTFGDLILVPETVEYYVTVRAYTVSGAFVEAYSNGVHAGLIHAILPGNISLPQFQSDGSSLLARWSGFQSNLPIRQYEWALGSMLHGNQKLAEFCSNPNANFSDDFDVSAFTSVGLDTSVRITNLSLQDSVTYYLTLRVLDQAKNCIARTTPEGVTIDKTPPTLETSSTSVVLGPRESRQLGSDFVIYVTGEEELVVEWEEFSDLESGIDSYSVGVYPQGVCGNNSWNIWEALFGPVDFGLANVANIGRVQFLSDIPYVVVVKATNKAGISARAFSQPILVDNSIPVPGTVKDGLNWGGDVQYQSDLSMLNAVFSYSMQPPTPESFLDNGPCPNDLFYGLNNYSSMWSSGLSAQLVGYSSSATVFSDSQVSVSTDPAGIAVTVFRDPTSTLDVLQSGIYQTRVDLRRGGMFQADVRSSRGFPTVQDIAVTAIVFVDSGTDSNVVPKFEPMSSSYNFENDGNFSAFGLQVYDNFTNSTHSLSPRVVLWARDPARLGQVLFLEKEVAQLDLSVANTYRLDFDTQQTNSFTTRTARLYINGIHTMTLYGLPYLTNSTRVVFTSFNERGLIPPPPEMATAELSSQAVFGNVSLPSPMSGDLCDYGTPFHSRTSPVVKFRVGIGTRPGVSDVHPLQMVATPCLSCLPGPCILYACNSSCSGDPYLLNVTLANLTLSPGYGTQLDISVNDSVISPPSNWFQPATYHVIVEATTASGKMFVSSSNGVVMDTSPPVLASPIVNYDFSFSRSQPIRFQGDNTTIAAGWRFSDEESFIVDYSWAIGTASFSTDVQGFVSVGVATVGVATRLTLVHNTTYFVTVVATNGAGLTATFAGSGVTYIATELNVTLLVSLVDVEFVREETFTDQDGMSVSVRVTDDDSRAGVSWMGVSQDIEDLNWQIGSSPGAVDILPPVPISLTNSALSSRARLASGVLYHGDQILTEVSEVIALYEGKEVDPLDNNLFLQPGSLLYQSIEFCNFVHVCTVSMGTPSIVIRRKDVEARVLFAGVPTQLLVTQTAPGGVNINSVHVLDRTYVLQLYTLAGLRVDSTLYAGFLDQSDVRKTYRSMTPYISNPFLTMSQTSRDVARRFTEFGGPSFYVSFLGQDSLDAALELNVTIDALLDWDIATPELAYWDTGASVWRQVSETCGNSSSVDLRTFTIAVQVCSTITEMATPSSRRRRQTIMTTPSSMTVADFLERPIQFIVMRVGNVSANTPPQLLLPSDPVQITEDTVYSVNLQYLDAESDVVDFSLDSVPNLGNVTLSAAGMLTYVPCQHCTGTDTIQISSRERPIGENHTPLMSTGQIVFQLINLNDAPDMFVYRDGIVSGASTGEVLLASTAAGFIEANRSSAAPVVTVAAVDVDGSQDSLTFVVLQDGQFGTASFTTRLDAVGILQSLPLTLQTDPANMDLMMFHGQVTFLSSYVTYLPSDPNFVGNDTFRIAVRDSRAVRSSTTLSVSVEVLPSVCLNGGTCAGSQTDPTCADIAARRGGADSYSCACPAGFTGATCEVALNTSVVTPVRDCPPGIPVVQCEGDPCRGAACPSHPLAECRANYCGSCKAEWYVGSDRVTCHAACANMQCDCPSQPYACPEDSVLVTNRVNDCCVTFDCVCPNSSCPVLMECGQGVRPLPRYRGNGFPGRCCPEYNYEDIDECATPSDNLCEDTCVNQDRTYSCSCPSGRTVANDGLHCGVCSFNDSQYLLGDRVQIGCNWCQCSSDALNGERWQCTSTACEDGCFSNGMLYPLGSTVSIGDLECVCSLTGRNSQDWMCAR